MFAVVKIAGKQFIVEAGKKIKINAKLEAKENKVNFSNILLVVDDKKVEVGKPEIAGASIDAEIVEVKKASKILVVKHHPKKRYRRTKGHRQDQTTLKIVKINQK
ncbi:50S ribosomal protein L21 [Candidatus Berkelbacteria bacterium CG08_land_8_20_14_0_20_39_8]|uniref:Large ribosomal subunit protein bL21 n=1 Tax=Candidatus Berkelbacteria bacterium CG08_land_8_20_14_0_20_39_8 TaxID=1974511 RepID=A0A2M6YCC6_9BACT|nr:MAG: 50S ribosomal protein L21 [Candidatus Berkelbacteria bacterium CG08_land_8_20_14_0_20_39_8]